MCAFGNGLKVTLPSQAAFIRKNFYMNVFFSLRVSQIYILYLKVILKWDEMNFSATRQWCIILGQVTRQCWAIDVILSFRTHMVCGLLPGPSPFIFSHILIFHFLLHHQIKNGWTGNVGAQRCQGIYPKPSTWAPFLLHDTFIPVRCLDPSSKPQLWLTAWWAERTGKGCAPSTKTERARGNILWQGISGRWGLEESCCKVPENHEGLSVA